MQGCGKSVRSKAAKKVQQEEQSIKRRGRIRTGVRAAEEQGSETSGRNRVARAAGSERSGVRLLPCTRVREFNASLSIHWEEQFASLGHLHLDRGSFS